MRLLAMESLTFIQPVHRPIVSLESIASQESVSQGMVRARHGNDAPFSPGRCDDLPAAAGALHSVFRGVTARVEKHCQDRALTFLQNYSLV